MPSSGSYDIVEAVLKKEAFRPSIRHYVNSDSGCISLVSRGLGVGVISSLQMRLLADNVVFKPLEGDFYRTLGVTVKSLEHATPAVKEFINMTIESASKAEKGKK